MIMKFGDMHYGQWFKEVGRKNARVMLKLQNVLPSGMKVAYDTLEVDYIPEGEDSRRAVTKPGPLHCNHFNAVDVDGIPCCCPDFVEFRTIASPFPQKVKHAQNS